MIVAGVALLTGLAAGPTDVVHALLPAFGAVLAALGALALAARRRGPAPSSGKGAWWADLLEGVRDAVHALRHPDWRLLGAVGYLAFDMAVLWATFAALGQRPAVASLVLAYNIGNLAGLIPVPGGIGVLDAGLVGMLVVYDVPTIDATAAVLVYHAIALWLPGLGGLLGLARLHHEAPSGDLSGGTS
jgi:uncharacterized membrane protein YbhN (UPF0104 family)